MLIYVQVLYSPLFPLSIEHIRKVCVQLLRVELLHRSPWGRNVSIASNE